MTLSNEAQRQGRPGASRSVVTLPARLARGLAAWLCLRWQPSVQATGQWLGAGIRTRCRGAAVQGRLVGQGE